MDCHYGHLGPGHLSQVASGGAGCHHNQIQCTWGLIKVLFENCFWAFAQLLKESYRIPLGFLYDS